MKVWWLTGLSGSGKTTIANALKKQLDKMGEKTIILDGDIVRTGLCEDLVFSPEDRLENLRRIAHVVNLFWNEGYNVICSFVSPNANGRMLVFDIFDKNDIDAYMVYLSTPLEVCEERDVKGLYKRARAGEIPNFTGIGQPYESLVIEPDYIFDTSVCSLDYIVQELVV
jgi:adenylyl-sulfate kinase